MKTTPEIVKYFRKKIPKEEEMEERLGEAFIFGRIQEMLERKEAGEKVTRDKEGNPVLKEIFSLADGELICRQKINWDKEGNPVSREIFSSDGGLLFYENIQEVMALINEFSARDVLTNPSLKDQ